MRNLRRGVLHSGVVLFHLQLQFGDFQSRKYLVLLHATSIVDVQVFYEAGLLSEYIDLLERNQLGGERQGPSQILSAYLYDTHRDGGTRGRSRFARIFGVDFPRAAAGGQNTGRCADQDEPQKLGTGDSQLGIKPRVSVTRRIHRAAHVSERCFAIFPAGYWLHKSIQCHSGANRKINSCSESAWTSPVARNAIRVPDAECRT